MFKNILVPTDGSGPSRRAIRSAVQLAKEQQARIVAFWVGPVWEPNLYAYAKSVPPGFITPRQHAEHVRKTAERYLAVVRRAAATAGVPCLCAHVEGVFPYLEIINAAQRNRCDLIVMGSHGRHGLQRLLLGSVAQKVLAESRVPVLICR